VESRPLIVLAGWLGAAMLALSIGLAATNVIGDDLSTASSVPLSGAEVEKRLGAVPTSTSAGTATASAPASAPASASASAAASTPAAIRKTFPTRGGTVIARCTGARVEIVGMSPAQGWAVHEQDSGPRTDAEAEFRGTADDHQRVKVDVRCSDGTPVIEVRLELDHD
jgi:hypothetical protein